MHCLRPCAPLTLPCAHDGPSPLCSGEGNPGQEFLAAMEALGQGKQYRGIILAEISQVGEATKEGKSRVKWEEPKPLG